MTICRRLKDSGMVCPVARIKESLSAGHIARRLQFAQENLNFPHWDKTVFIDQATFETGSAYRTLIRRPIGKFHHGQFLINLFYLFIMLL